MNVYPFTTPKRANAPAADDADSSPERYHVYSDFDTPTRVDTRRSGSVAGIIKHVGTPPPSSHSPRSVADHAAEGGTPRGPYPLVSIRTTRSTQLGVVVGNKCQPPSPPTPPKRHDHSGDRKSSFLNDIPLQENGTRSCPPRSPMPHPRVVVAQDDRRRIRSEPAQVETNAQLRGTSAALEVTTPVRWELNEEVQDSFPRHRGAASDEHSSCSQTQASFHSFVDLLSSTRFELPTLASLSATSSSWTTDQSDTSSTTTSRTRDESQGSKCEPHFHRASSPPNAQPSPKRVNAFASAVHQVVSSLLVCGSMADVAETCSYQDDDRELGTSIRNEPSPSWEARPQNRAILFNGQARRVRSLRHDQSLGQTTEDGGYSIRVTRSMGELELKSKTSPYQLSESLHPVEEETPEDIDDMLSSSESSMMWNCGILTPFSSPCVHGNVPNELKEDVSASVELEIDDLCYDSDSGDMRLRTSATPRRITIEKKDMESMVSSPTQLPRETSQEQQVPQCSAPDTACDLEYDDEVSSQVVQDTCNEDLHLIWHPPCNKVTATATLPSPVACVVWIERGVILESKIVLPKLMWRPKPPIGLGLNVRWKEMNQTQTPRAVALLDISRINRVTTKGLDRATHPYARTDRCFVLQLVNGTVEVFEASSAFERDRIVNRLKLVVAALASKVISDDKNVYQEFFFPGGRDAYDTYWTRNIKVRKDPRKGGDSGLFDDDLNIGDTSNTRKDNKRMVDKKNASEDDVTLATASDLSCFGSRSADDDDIGFIELTLDGCRVPLISR